MVTNNVIAVIIVVSASTCSNLGTNIQKQSHNKELAKRPADRRKYHHRPEWWYGFFLTVCGALADFVALGFGQPSLVTAVGGSTTLTGNLVVAKFWNEEEIQKTDIMGVFSIVISAVIIAVQTPPSQDLSLSELYAKYNSVTVVVFLIFLLISLAVSMLFVSQSYINKRVQEFVYNLSGKMLKRVYDQHLELSARINAIDVRLEALEKHMRRRNISFADTTMVFHEAIDEAKYIEAERVKELLHQHQKSPADPYIYAGCAGVVGALSVLLGGVSSKLLINAVQGEWTDFESVVPYLFLGGMMVTLYAQVDLQNTALQLGDAMSVYPVFMAFWIGFGTLGSIVLFENHHWKFMKTVSYTTGFLFLFLGVAMLTKHTNREIQMEEDELRSELDATDLTQLLLLRDLESERQRQGKFNDTTATTPLLETDTGSGDIEFQTTDSPYSLTSATDNTQDFRKRD